MNIRLNTDWRQWGDVEVSPDEMEEMLSRALPNIQRLYPTAEIEIDECGAFDGAVTITDVEECDEYDRHYDDDRIFSAALAAWRQDYIAIDEDN